ncbi:MAG: hypothetical protein ACK523_08925 [Pirellulaceae bacterium]
MESPLTGKIHHLAMVATAGERTQRSTFWRWWLPQASEHNYPPSGDGGYRANVAATASERKESLYFLGNLAARAY